MGKQEALESAFGKVLFGAGAKVLGLRNRDLGTGIASPSTHRFFGFLQQALGSQTPKREEKGQPHPEQHTQGSVSEALTKDKLYLVADFGGVLVNGFERVGMYP